MTGRVLKVAGFEVAVKERPTRSTMELTVDRDGSLFVAVPAGIPDEPVIDFVDSRQDWIHRKLIAKADFLPVLPPKQLVNGEGFRYLGRNYRLLLLDNQDAPVKLLGGRLLLCRRETNGGAAIRSWYRSRGEAWLRERVERWAERCDVPDVQLGVRELGYRWGSFGDARQLNVHWATLQLPPSMIDYVLVHELTHAHHKGHTRLFWTHVARVLPDHDQRRERLHRYGRQLWLGDVVGGGSIGRRAETGTGSVR